MCGVANVHNVRVKDISGDLKEVGGFEMKVEVEIPEGKNCTRCMFHFEALDSWDYEESHDHCAYLDKPLNDEVVYTPKRVKKHPDCPALK